MLKTKLSLLLLILFVAGILIACEQPPGEFTGTTKYADGRPASVIVKIFDAADKVVAETTSSVDGVWYTGRVIMPGTYTIKCFRGDAEVGSVASQTIEADGSIAVDVTVQ
jgi:hypothetical protein